jgi:dipeptidyl aminopeptidase/acylaminoacyl peptidase
MPELIVAPYGAWESPLPLSLLTVGVIHLIETPTAADGVRWWIEGRPEEEGRQVLIRRDPDGTQTRLTPEGFNARTRVHEYGGAPYLIDGDLVVVSDFVTGRLNRVVAPGQLEPLTLDRQWRFADLAADPDRKRVIAIREDHEPETIARHGQAENAIVAIDVTAGEVTVLVDGADFYAAPRLSPDGKWLAWLEWHHPNMPWDGTELRLAPVGAEGALGTPATIAGSTSDWISQPRWSPHGVLHFVAEPTGWMNLYRLVDGRVEAVAPMEAEFAPPDWHVGNSSSAFLADGSVVAVGRSRGRDRLYRIDATGHVDLIDVPFTEMRGLTADGHRVVLLGASPAASTAVVDLDPASGAWTTLQNAMSVPIEPADLSVPESVEFPTTGGRTAFGLYYPPYNRSFRGPEGTRPPLLVYSHGGPTSAATTDLSFVLPVQLLASRGIATLDVEYGGSTGRGRAYRQRLEGEWGVVDVDDCCNGARWLAQQGLVDVEHMGIIGGSASGYTTLCAVTFRDVFRAGISYFGIGDLETSMADLHKFESRYGDRLIGPYPERKDLWHDRSPLNFPNRISCPILIMQGTDDRIVPPAQAEQIVEALRQKQLPHAYLLFPGEGHGFRAAETIIRSFEGELSFLGQIFGFEPADPIDPLEVQFLADDRRTSAR